MELAQNLQKEIDRVIAEIRSEGQTKTKTAAKVNKQDALKERVRAEYKQASEHLKNLRKVDQEVRDEIKARTGAVVSPGNKLAWNEYGRELKKKGISSSTITDASLKVSEILGRHKWLAEEETAKAIAKNEEEWKGLSREDKKKLVKEQLETVKRRQLSLERVEDDIKTWSKMMKESPELKTYNNRVALIALRLERIKLKALEREERLARAKENESLIKDSPKYSKTPGSMKPIKAMKPEEIAADLYKIEQSFLAKAEKLEKEGKESAANALRVEASMARRGADHYKNGYSGNPPLELLYQKQGYNAKPELVPTRTELEKRKDLLKGEDGKPLLLWRGVTGEDFATQFKGGGVNGDVHYAGQGIYGNGTYAASHAPGTQNKQGAFSEAKSYAGYGNGAPLEKRLTAFGIRNDANVVQFQGESWRDRSDRFGEWQNQIRDAAQAKTGMTFNDVGEAAAAMGIHAYRVPQGRDEDFWVILNRGALVMAAEPEINTFLEGT